MKLSDLIRAVSKKSGSTIAESKAVVNYLFETLKEELVSEGDICIVPNFGSFKVKKRIARQGRNPQTGKAMEIPEKLVLVFKQSKSK